MGDNDSDMQDDAVDQRLSMLKLAAERPGKAARLPSDESMLIGVQDFELKRSGITVVPVGGDAPEDDRAKIAYTFFKGTEFQALNQVGNKTPKELDRELVYIMYDGNYYTKNGLWHAIKAPDGQLGEAVKRDQNGKTVFKGRKTRNGSGI
ncbi:hypothetical protein [Sinorhizobium medicae]|uniref:hypothetical protein n=1 Tax=Sinorhizobium medicae TaxID=110321 RepID=UPI0012F82526|nr:hypothetical protein [Sinorhizobium medicae]